MLERRLPRSVTARSNRAHRQKNHSREFARRPVVRLRMSRVRIHPSGRTMVPSRRAPSRSRAREQTFLFQPRTSWGDNVRSSRAQSRSSLAAANERTGALRHELLLALDASSLLRKLARMNSYGRSINHELIRILLLSSRRTVTRRASIETAAASNRRRRRESASPSLHLISSFPSDRRDRDPGSMHIYDTSINPNTPSRDPPPPTTTRRPIRTFMSRSVTL